MKRVTRRNALASLVAAGIGMSAYPIATMAEQDPWLGRWVGTVRHGNESAVFGLEFRTNRAGKTVAVLWNPSIHVYGVPSAYAQPKGRAMNLADLGISLKLVGSDTIHGTLNESSTSLVLHRTTAMPAAPAHGAMEYGQMPASRWREHGAPVWATPLVANDTVYVGDASGHVRALRANDGQALWTYDAGASIFGRLTLASDDVFVLDDAQTLHRIDGARGRKVWSKALAPGVPRKLPGTDNGVWDYSGAHPVIADGVLYIGTADGGFRALDMTAGATMWTSRSDGAIRAGALVDDDFAIVGKRNGDLIAIERSTGGVVWRKNLGGPIVTEPIDFDGLAIVGSRGSLLTGIEKRTGKVRWERYFWASWVDSAPVIVDGIAYIGSSDLRSVQAFDPKSGTAKWQTDVLGWSWGTPLVRDGRVFFGAASGAPYIQPLEASAGALDARTGRWQWRSTVLPPAIGAYVAGYACGPAGTSDGIVFASVDGSITSLPVS